MDDETGYEMVMPFVVCASQGGPYDDDAFVAGYQLGLLGAKLSTALVVDQVATLRADSLPQFDLLAMRYGRSYTVLSEVDGWATVAVRKG